MVDTQVLALTVMTLGTLSTAYAWLAAHCQCSAPILARHKARKMWAWRT